jgi:hypothetical protein
VTSIGGSSTVWADARTDAISALTKTNVRAALRNATTLARREFAKPDAMLSTIPHAGTLFL